MIKIKVLNALREEIIKIFKKRSDELFDLFETLLENPNKGSILGHVGSISIRELRFDSYRIYFILNGHELSLYNSKKLAELLIRFIRMSKKNDQQKTIDEIKNILKNIGASEFEE
jgi:hypothetical protein